RAHLTGFRGARPGDGGGGASPAGGGPGKKRTARRHGPPGARLFGAPPAPLRVRCGYEAVANVGYAPIEPVDLLVRASTALRTGRAESGSWLRRFDDGVSTAPP